MEVGVSLAGWGIEAPVYADEGIEGDDEEFGKELHCVEGGFGVVPWSWFGAWDRC